MVRKLNINYLSNYQHITQIYPSYESGFNYRADALNCAALQKF